MAEKIHMPAPSLGTAPKAVIAYDLLKAHVFYLAYLECNIHGTLFSKVLPRNRQLTGQAEVRKAARGVTGSVSANLTKAIQTIHQHTVSESLYGFRKQV